MKNTNGIVKTFNENDFINEFRLYDRKDNFSYKGLCILFESLEQTAIDCGMNIEMDVIGLCCEYSEDSAEDIAIGYNIGYGEEGEDINQLVTEYLQDNTFVCGQYEDDDGVTYFIYQSF